MVGGPYAEPRVGIGALRVGGGPARLIADAAFRPDDAERATAVAGKATAKVELGRVFLYLGGQAFIGGTGERRQVAWIPAGGAGRLPGPGW